MILVLDLDGVVVTGQADGGGRWDRHLERDFKLRPDLLREHLFFTKHWAAIITGRADLHETLVRIWPRLNCEGEPRAFMDYWFAADSNVDPGVLALVSNWRKGGGNVFLATNQEHYRARHLWDAMALKDHFDGMIYSAEVGAAKPDALYFARAFEKLPAAHPSDILFLDDAPANVEAAAAAGWTARLYRNVEDLRAALRDFKV